MKNVGNNSSGRSQGVPKIFGAPMCGHLCDSTAFLFFFCACIFVDILVCIVYVSFCLLSLPLVANKDEYHGVAKHFVCGDSKSAAVLIEWVRILTESYRLTSMYVAYQSILYRCKNCTHHKMEHETSEDTAAESSTTKMSAFLHRVAFADYLHPCCARIT